MDMTMFSPSSLFHQRDASSDDDEQTQVDDKSFSYIQRSRQFLGMKHQISWSCDINWWFLKLLRPIVLWMLLFIRVVYINQTEFVDPNRRPDQTLWESATDKWS